MLIQGANILRITALYKPLKIFSAFAAVFLGIGTLFGLRVLAARLSNDPQSHVLALWVSAVFIAGFWTYQLW